MNFPLDVIKGMIEGHEKYEIRRKARIMTPKAKAKALKIRKWLG